MTTTTSAVYDTLAGAAAGLGIPPAKLRRAKRMGCPAFRGGRVHVAELVEWLRTMPSTEGKVGVEREQAETRRTLAAARMAEHRLRVAKGTVIGFEQAKRVFGLCAAKVKTRVLAAASKLAPLCEGKDLLARQELMTAELTDALGELDRAKMTEGNV